MSTLTIGLIKCPCCGAKKDIIVTSYLERIEGDVYETAITGLEFYCMFCNKRFYNEEAIKP